jgi:superfamily I DNA/RNA helicase
VIRLSDDQRRIVECPHDGGHLLVLAGPGSGKTRVICERIGYLLSHHLAEPKHVLALSFTQRAGAELAARLADLGHDGIEAGTIHHRCAALLDRYGAVIGIPSPLRIADGARQQALLRRAIVEVVDRPPTVRQVRDMQSAISRRKSAQALLTRREVSGVRPDDVLWHTRQRGPYNSDRMQLIDEAYCRLLLTDGVLDFDDLIASAIRVLDEDEPIASIIHARWRYIFVDEFHDLSPDQYKLLTLLVPARMPERQVMVVADPHQSIFSFRDADVRQMLEHYQRDYAPRRYKLHENFRSDGQIVRVVSRLMPEAGTVKITKSDGQEVSWCEFSTPEDEAKGLADLIERACASGSYVYADMAVLYRRHKRADLAEQTLLSRGIPIRRLQPDRFFDEPEVQEALRYLDLIASIHDSSFEPALNWPRVLVDELTMIDLRRLVRESGLSLSQLATRPDMLANRVSPLTRVAIDEFRTTIAAELVPLANQPISVISERLLALLTRRRDPIPRADRIDLIDTLAFLGRHLEPAAAVFDAAIRAGRPLALDYAASFDATAGAVILRWLCERYVDHPLASPDTPGAFVVRLGHEQAATADGFGIGPWATRTVTFGVAAQAWRLGQMTLMQRERRCSERFVIVDLETGSTHANTTELLEVAALRVVDGQQTESFESLVRPRSAFSISSGATDVHGLTWADVRNAPPASTVVPELLHFLEDDTLVGHYADEFDFLVLRRVARELSLPRPANFTLDTCTLARRLLPNEPYALEDLARRFGVSSRQTHRAGADVEMTAIVLTGLLGELRIDKELGALSEALPLVALAIVASGQSLTADNALLARSGARALAFNQGSDLIERLTRAVDKKAIDFGRRELARLSYSSADDARWDALLQRWREMVNRYCRTNHDTSLVAFLHFTALAHPPDIVNDDAGHVTMMTIHSAKGQEWPLVFLIGVEEGELPLYLAQTPAEVDEERRVLYVGMTRAKERLCLLWSASRDGHPASSSHFLKELPDSLLRRYRSKSAGQRPGRSDS